MRRCRTPEAGRRRPRSDPDHRRRLHRRRGPRQGQRRKRGIPGAVADGDQARASRRHGHHRRHAADRTAGQSGGEFCHLRPCGAADRAGADGGRAAEKLVLSMPGFRRGPSPTGRRSAAANMSAGGARSLRRAADGAVEDLRKGDGGVLQASKFPREGAGLLSSLVDTDGSGRTGRRTLRRSSARARCRSDAGAEGGGPAFEPMQLIAVPPPAGGGLGRLRLLQRGNCRAPRAQPARGAPVATLFHPCRRM